MEKEEQFFIKRMNELADMAIYQYRPIFTEFLTLYESSIIFSNVESLASVSVQSWGGYKEAERRLFCFSPMDFLPSKEEFPISCVHIFPKNQKFASPLSHRDFLGAILNLGIDRKKTGDILVNEKEAWLFCKSEIATFLIEYLKKVKHTCVFCENITQSELSSKIFYPKIQIIKGFVSTLRLDTVISLAFHSSRNHMAEYIHAKKVFINGKLVAENSIKIKENDLISVRGVGKFRYIGIEGESKKGRLVIKIEKYV